jgi:hypothetical protein
VVRRKFCQAAAKLCIAAKIKSGIGEGLQRILVEFQGQVLFLKVTVCIKEKLKTFKNILLWRK